jgi:hypothetical protein
LVSIDPSGLFDAHSLEVNELLLNGGHEISTLPNEVVITVSSDTRAQIEVFRHRFYEEGMGAESCADGAEDPLP